MKILFCVLIPFIGTFLGSASVYFVKNKMNIKTEKILLGITAGIMVVAAIWSLIIPSINASNSPFPACIGFIIGILFLINTDKILNKLKKCKCSKYKNSFMITLALTLHNIPEGMSVGIAIAAALSNNSLITFNQAMILAIGIAIQNIPEGSIISVPLYNSGMSKNKAFWYSALSGIVELFSTIITILLTFLIVPAFPYFLAFAGGAMFYVVINELVPDLNKSKIGTIGFTIGFCLMLILENIMV